MSDCGFQGGGIEVRILGQLAFSRGLVVVCEMDENNRKLEEGEISFKMTRNFKDFNPILDLTKHTRGFSTI